MALRLKLLNFLYRSEKVDQYIINKNSQSNGDHEVHNKTKGCSYLPALENQIVIGNFF